MFKIFPELRSRMAQREAMLIYPNRAFIMINVIELIEERDGVRIHNGLMGDLYAMADNSPEGVESRNEALKDLKGQDVYLFDSYNKEDRLRLLL